MSRMHNFKKSLSVGKMGEVLFFRGHCKILEQTDGRSGDFRHKKTGEIWELKSDMYPMEATPNYFIERFSDGERETPGGPYQALEHGASRFVYFYVADLTYHAFDTKELVQELEKIIPTLEPVEINNTNHVTIGYRVPRTALAHIAEEVVMNVSVEKKK